jgi:hypothetical protein
MEQASLFEPVRAGSGNGRYDIRNRLDVKSSTDPLHELCRTPQRETVSPALRFSDEKAHIYRLR